MSTTAPQSTGNSPPDLDRLAGQLIKLAKDRLAELGQFYPFAAVVQSDGSLAQLNYNPPDRAPLVARFIDALKDNIRKGARQGEFRAAGICFLAQAACPPDKRVAETICVQLHDATGQSASLFVPLTRTQGAIAYAEAFQTAGPASLFPEPEPDDATADERG